MSGLSIGHKRMWVRYGTKDARMSLSETHVDSRLAACVNYYLPEHFADARKFYLIGFRRTGRRILKREYHQRAGLVG